jgi:hypothetical protein
VVLTISGREIHTVTNSVAHITSAEIDLWMQVSVKDIKVIGASYLMPDNRINPIAPPPWLEIALRILDAVNFVRIITGFGGRVAGLLLFTIGRGLQSAGDAVKAEVRDSHTARITYRRGWGTNVASDTIVIPLVIPSLSGRDTPTELEIRLVCLDGLCVSPRLKAYVQPDSVYYETSIHRPVKNWMFRGQTSDVASYYRP